MIIKSDWHIHTNNSYDASLPLETIAEGARKLNLKVNILSSCVGTAYPHKINKISKKLKQYGVAYL